jgi:hypothetical protein
MTFAFGLGQQLFTYWQIKAKIWLYCLTEFSPQLLQLYIYLD